MTQRNEPKHPDPIVRRVPPPAPYLTSRSTCSECHVPSVIAGNGDIKICPKCHALLWHRDYAAEQRQQKLKAEKIAAEAAAIRRAEKEAQQRLNREAEAEAKPKP